MILEGLVTTLDAAGRMNVAPMGPILDGPDPNPRSFVLRPFVTSTTFANLKAMREGVLHVTDDVLLLARAAIGLPVDPPSRPADVVTGRILLDACRYFEFRIVNLDESRERTTLRAETVAHGRLRDYFGLNRAKHAVVEAAILATRTAILPMSEILESLERLAVPVEKTGGAAERQAFALLRDFVQADARTRGVDLGDA